MNSNQETCSCGNCPSNTVKNSPSAENNVHSLPTAIVYHTFVVEGLDCADCATKLEKQLLSQSGIHSASLNFGAGKLTVGHTLTESQIIQFVRQSGYHAAPDSGYTKNRSPFVVSWWKKAKNIATLASGILLLAALLIDQLNTNSEISVFLYLSAIAVGGYHTAKTGLYSLKNLTMDINFLMIIAVIGAIAIKEWSEGATVVFLFALGNALQSYTMDKTRQSIRSLMDLAPREALIRRENTELSIAVEDVLPGDVLIVKPGDRIAMDGTVLTGNSTVNQAPITGESIPVEKNAGDSVYAGTINQQGAMEVTVTRLAADSTLAKIMHLVEEAQEEKAPIQQFVDVFAKYYTPAVIAAALGLMFLPYLVFHQPFDVWFYRSLVLLVISCPCALVISTPVSIVSAIGNASRRGVLIKGGAYLEQMGHIRAIAFDKTGTLTIGKPTVTNILPLDDISAEELLQTAAAVEKWSEHPLAQAIVAKADSGSLPSATGVKAWVGRGIQAVLNGHIVYIGNRRLFEELNIPLDNCEHHLTTLEDQGKTVMIIGKDDRLLGIIAVSDILRKDSPAALQELRESGIQNIAMLTGDNKRVAAAIAKELRLPTFYSELLPEDKVAALKLLIRQYDKVAMVGDGINDAPALATATVGIAMGAAGSDTALETADIALMSDDLSKLAYIMKLSKKTVSIIRQNITFSIAIKLLFLAGTFVGFVNLWLAVLADTGAALIVTLNGMRLIREVK